MDKHVLIIASEAFFKAMRSISSFRGDCDIRAWLCQIAKNCYYSYLKKIGQTNSIDDIELSELPSGESTIEEQCIAHEESAQIRTVLHHVPEPYKEVFICRFGNCMVFGSNEVRTAYFGRAYRFISGCLHYKSLYCIRCQLDFLFITS